MGWCLLDDFDTLEEAQAFVEKLVKDGWNGMTMERERLQVFDDKDFPDLGKRYSVNYD